MYSNQTQIANPELAPWVAQLSAMLPEEIATLLATPTVENVPDEARQQLMQHEWACASRAMCFRTTRDDPEAWRNATPPDKTPIILDFKQVTSNPPSFMSRGIAAEFDHIFHYRYIGQDDEGRHRFISTVTRSSLNHAEDKTSGYELVTLIGDGSKVSLYLGNDGKASDLPKAFREVRVWKEKSIAAAELALR